MSYTLLPIPPHFNPQKVGEVWRVLYLDRAKEAMQWAKTHQIQPAVTDKVRICLLAVDVQNTFCIPGYELFVTGAVEDNIRLCEFVYRNLGVITEINPTMDTHLTFQIFHPVFWVNDAGEHPAPHTIISVDDVKTGVWKINPLMNIEGRRTKGRKDATASSRPSASDHPFVLAQRSSFHPSFLTQHALHYVQKLQEGGKYPLIIWPYHAMLGGIGHALVSAVEEAFFFHNLARFQQTGFEIKGDNPLTEHYSVLRPEVLEGPDGKPIGVKNTQLIAKLIKCDKVFIAGQAKSHCVAWTIDDLLDELKLVDPGLAKKVFLLEDCTSPVVIPGVVDFTEQANQAFERFAKAGMHIVRSTEPI